MSDIKKYTQANREAWNEAMPHHQKSNADKWDIAFSDKGFSVIKEPELSLIESLNFQGQKIAHVCCNNGVELMSLKNMGAGECVGFDISDEAIQEARERAARVDIACEFVQTDAYDIPEKYHDTFDIVYISIGCLGWMPAIQRFFGKVAALLNEDGELFIHESHPFSEMLPSDDLDNVDPMKIIEPYFKQEPYIDNDGIDNRNDAGPNGEDFTRDHDNDGSNDADDTDDDNDDILDVDEVGGATGTYRYDHDNDGIWDSTDTDDDNDGLSDWFETNDGNSLTGQFDHDNDGSDDNEDDDDDNDGIEDILEV